MELLDDQVAESYSGGGPFYVAGPPVVTNVSVGTGDITVSPEVGVVSATQVNNSTIVVAFGGYKSTFKANVASYQFNGLG